MEIIKYIQSFSSPFLDMFFSFITHVGAQTLGIFLAILFFWCIDKKFGYRFLYGILFSFSLNNVVKGIFKAPRPIGVEGIHSSEVQTATGDSFPSGHSQGNATTVTILIDQFRYKWLIVIGVIMLILVPVSRLYLGVHWPRDVIWGTIIGIVSAIISNKIFNLSNIKGRYILVISLLLYLSLGLFFPSDDLFKALGAFTGFIVGMLIEEKYINFNANTSLKNNIIKVIIGLLGAGLIYLGFSIFADSIMISFIKYFSITFFAIVIAPIIFIKLKLT